MRFPQIGNLATHLTEAKKGEIMGIFGTILGVVACVIIVLFTLYTEYVVGSLIARDKKEVERFAFRISGLGTLFLDLVICISPILTAVQLYFAERPELYETSVSAARRGGAMFIWLVSMIAFLSFYGMAKWAFETYSVYSSKEEEEEDFQEC